MEFIPANEIEVLSNSGVESQQLLFPENSASARLTITKVTVAPGAASPPHRHEFAMRWPCFVKMAPDCAHQPVTSVPVRRNR